MHIPLRMCTVCRQMKPKSELIRIVKTSEGIAIDHEGKAQTRGAYICANGECAKNAPKKKALERSFKCAVDKDIYEQIESEVLRRNG